MKSFDAIVVGGGHNGLVAAAVLGKSGRKVLLLEADQELGGAARTHEFAPGFRVSPVAHLVNRLHPEVVAALELERHGLDTGPAGGAPSVALSAGGAPLTLHGAYGDRLDGAGAAEAEAWAALRAQLLRYSGILKPFLARRPPALDRPSLADGSALGMAALSLRRLGKEDMRDFLRMLLMNVADVVDEHLTDNRLKGLLAFDAVLGSHLGPRSPTSLLGLYHRLAGETGGVPGAQFVPRGGLGTLLSSFASAAESAGVEIRTAAPVARIAVEKGRAAGVVMADGEEIRTGAVLSAVNPKTTFLDLVGPRALDTGFVRKIGHVRMKGDAAKLHLALDRPPQFPGVAEAELGGRLVIAPSVDHVERAFNPAKYGEFSPEPVMEIVLPSVGDTTLAPQGAAVLSAVVQYAPYQLKEGWATGKPKLLAAVMAQLEAHAPGIAKLVRHSELLTPADIEARFRMPGGHWHHGELQADQMLMARPVPEAAGYDTPIEALFLAGAGSHPGGGISGVPGLNAARRVIATKG